MAFAIGAATGYGCAYAGSISRIDKVDIECGVKARSAPRGDIDRFIHHTTHADILRHCQHFSGKGRAIFSNFVHIFGPSVANWKRFGELYRDISLILDLIIENRDLLAEAVNAHD